MSVGDIVLNLATEIGRCRKLEKEGGGVKCSISFNSVVNDGTCRMEIACDAGREIRAASQAIWKASHL